MSVRRGDGFAALSDYGLLGDGHAGALVAADGTIDWFAAPRLDSPPICAALLDPGRGGCFTLSPDVERYDTEQRYLDDTLTVRTTFRCREGTVRVTDVLNRGWSGPLPWTELAREVEAVEGRVPMRWSFVPGDRLGAGQPRLSRTDGHFMLREGGWQLALLTDGAGEPAPLAGGVGAGFTATPDSPALVAAVVAENQPLRVPDPAAVRARRAGTEDGWRRWSADIDYTGPHQAAVRRSALTLKALTRIPEGGIAAALTTSLPERVGARRNFDYRFGWSRDASFVLDALVRLGVDEDVDTSLAWLLRAVGRTAPSVRSFYTLDGAPASAQASELRTVPGYRGSRPVRIGNRAASQLQLGVFGDVLGAAWRYVRHGGYLDAGSAATLARLADQVCESWHEPDAGIWELCDYSHYTISKMSCWTALDRAIQLAERGQLPAEHAWRWRRESETVQAWTDRHCWSPSRGSYTFRADGDELGAAVLLAARSGYLTGDDPRLSSTIDAVRTELDAGGPLLYRYTGMGEREGAFLACSFWLVEALCTAGRLAEAEPLLDELVGLGGATGLLTEELDPNTGELCGNLPQALSHLALIGAATAVECARNPAR